jgi:biopolymer transport protein ExbB
MPPTFTPIWLFSFCRWASILGLTLLLGCTDAQHPSLQTSDFVDALRENGFDPEIIKPVVPTHEIGGKSELLLRVEGFEYDLGKYDLSSPESIRRFREKRAGSKSENNSTQYSFENLNLVLSCDQRPDPDHLEVFRDIRPPVDIRQAGWFLYPLGICLTIAVFIFVERCFALRRNRTIPKHIEDSLHSDRITYGDMSDGSAAGRLAGVAARDQPSPDILRAYARLEISAMEKGIFLLEIIVGIAPLIGLLGTVTGLVRVFSGMPADSGTPDASAFSEGIAMALLTTIIGLAIAIPSLVGHSFLSRIIDNRATQLEWLAERLSESRNPSKNT